VIIIDRGQCVYYIKEESIVLQYNKQYTSFNVYALQNRKKFKDFKLELLESNANQYNNIHDILSLAMRHGLRGMLGHKPIVKDDDIIIK